MTSHTTVTAPDVHRCIQPKGSCRAVRCTCCGMFEHRRPYELPAECLHHDLYRAYVEGTCCGPGLVAQLVAALARPSASRRGGEGGTRNKPGSKPPGWNADASTLLADIRQGAADRDVLEDWRRQARTILGFAIPSIGLDEVCCFVCGQPSLRVAQDAQSDVWCSSPLCHDDDQHPECLDLLGYQPGLGYHRSACRRTDRALTHSVRWDRRSWAPIWQQMQDAS